MAFGVLAGAVFLCARPGTQHVAAGHAAAGHAAAGHPAARHAAGPAGSAASVFCVSPHDLPGCSPFSHVTPGVLPGPPPAAAPAGGEPVPAGRPAHAGRQQPLEALARGPDLYALRVLRT
ncbi:hypothetical protein ABZY44_16170 [Streptomyces sp. NPDC006544]|uniref:hypothetical protein n=1 Tax=Streptomyces sp. NPDC006544 TaxID=3154583 RepID=UPI0033B4120C